MDNALGQRLLDTYKKVAPKKLCRWCGGSRTVEIRGECRDIGGVDIPCSHCRDGTTGEFTDEAAALIKEVEESLKK